MRAAFMAYALIGVTVSTAQSINPQNKTMVAIGQGLSSCGEYLEAFSVERKAKQPGDSPEGYRTARYGSFLNFADGFITGANFGDPDNREVGRNTDHAGRMAWLENYCRAKPLNGFIGALVALRNFIITGR